MTPTCILINGPKGVGKDTAALAIQRDRPQIAVVSVMKTQKSKAIENAGLDPRLYFELFEQFKDRSFVEIANRTPRELYIEWGERQRAGDPTAIIHAWRNEIIAAETFGATVVVTPDVRFFPEFASALQLFKPQNVLLLRVYKAPPVRWTDGLSFEGDIGSYFPTGSMWGHHEQVIVNDLSLEHYRAEASVIGNGFIARRRLVNAR